MILHLWSHWFWITGLVLALLSPNVSAFALNEPLRDPESPRSLTEANVISRTTLSPANNINRSLNQSLNANVEGTINNESRTDAREPKSIPRFNARFAVANSDSPLEPSSVTHPFKASSEVSSTEVISTDLNDSYLVDETSNVSVASNRNPVAYNVDSSNGSKAENGSLLSLTTEAASTITTSTPQLITISKININKVLKGKSPEEKAVKKNITNSINGITLKKILASNKTKQQQVPLNNTSVAVNATQLNTNEFKEVDHTAYQNDSPTLVLEQNRTTDSVQTAKVVPVHVPVKNETEEEDPLFDNSSELSFNSSAENSSASFSTLNQRIFAPEDNALSSFNIVVIVVISAAVVVVTGLVGALSFVMYRRYRWNKPQTLSDKCSNADSSGYIDDSTLRENSEEMYSLDNDSFLNSLEAMTIQNYWTDVKHTKL